MKLLNMFFAKKNRRWLESGFSIIFTATLLLIIGACSGSNNGSSQNTTAPAVAEVTAPDNGTVIGQLPDTNASAPVPVFSSTGPSGLELTMGSDTQITVSTGKLSSSYKLSFNVQNNSSPSAKRVSSKDGTDNTSTLVLTPTTCEISNLNNVCKPHIQHVGSVGGKFTIQVYASQMSNKLQNKSSRRINANGDNSTQTLIATIPVDVASTAPAPEPTVTPSPTPTITPPPVITTGKMSILIMGNGQITGGESINALVSFSGHSWNSGDKVTININSNNSDLSIDPPSCSFTSDDSCLVTVTANTKAATKLDTHLSATASCTDNANCPTSTVLSSTFTVNSNVNPGFLSLTVESNGVINMGQSIKATVSLNASHNITDPVVVDVFSNPTYVGLESLSCSLTTANSTCPVTIKGLNLTSGTQLIASANGYTTTVTQIQVIPTYGALSISLNPANIQIGQTSVATITLEGANGITDLPVTVLSSPADIVDIASPTCIISASSNGQNTCTVNITGSAAGNSDMSAIADFNGNNYNTNQQATLNISQTPGSEYIASLAVFDNNIYAASQNGYVYISMDATHWYIFGNQSPDGSRIRSMMISRNGTFYVTTFNNNIVKGDSTGKWSIVADFPTGNYPHALLEDMDHNIYVATYDGYVFKHLETDNTSGWKLVGKAKIPGGEGVFAMAYYKNQNLLYVTTVGAVYSLSLTDPNATWTRFGGDFTTPNLSSIVVGEGNVVFVAELKGMVTWWTGNTWQEVGGYTRAYVNTIMLDGDTIYVATDNGLLKSAITNQNGWLTPSGFESITGPVTILTLDGNNLYAATKGHVWKTTK